MVSSPFADGREPCGWRDRIVGLARGLDHVRRLGACVLERDKARPLGVCRAQPRINLPALVLAECIEPRLLFVAQQAIEFI